MADVDGEPCTSHEGITITAEVTSIADELTVTGSVVSKTPAVYGVTYQPIKCGQHEVIVKINGTPINISPFAILVRNNPHPNYCKAIGEQVESAQKNKPAKFMVQLADAESDPCVTAQEVTAVLKSLKDGSITNADVVSQTPATYEVAYQPSKSGEHKLSVKVNGMEIHGSPFALLVHNIPDPRHCKAVGEGISKAEKHKTSEFMVQLADAEGDPCVTEQNVTAELQSLVDGSITKANVVRKTPATYEVSYQPNKSGEHELNVKVNGVHMNGSPTIILVSNIPDPQNCRAVGIVKRVKKCKTVKFNVELADAEGEPCVTRQYVTARLIPADNYRYNFYASVIHVSSSIYEVSYQAKKSTQYKLIVEVNDREIKSSPFDLLVYNTPHPHNCKVKIMVSYTPFQQNLMINPVISHLRIFEQPKKHHSIIVELADEYGEPCITTQNVTAIAKYKESMPHQKKLPKKYMNLKVHSLNPAAYRVEEPEECPWPVEISSLTVYVNEMTIQTILSQGGSLHNNF